MMKDFLLYEKANGLVTLTMNQPQLRNALTGNAAVDDFVEACDRIQADASVRVVIVTANGSVFSSGGNIHLMQEYIEQDLDLAKIREEYRTGIQRLTRALFNLEVPLIAAVNGPAIGAGCDLACMCDIRIASEKARFAESFVKMGLVAGDGGAWFLPRVVGMSHAAEMTFTGEALDATQALDFGLVSKVVPAACLLDEARRLAERIAANPARVVRMSKRLLREGQNASLDSLLEMSAGFQAIAHKSSDHKEAVRSFIEKRPAVFCGT
jgi:enoyl-CoA hydratase/carnithine racemase